MKKFLIVALPVVLLYACGKSSNTEPCDLVAGSPNTVELANIEAYLSLKGITATRDPRGFYYNIAAPGYGNEYPNLNSNITIRYKGELTTGQVFDSTAGSTTTSFALRNLILGWQFGIPLARKGAVINLYLPPSLGYGCEASGSIPAKSTLIFRIEMVDFF
jgi:FKBP-type peptidyl-prolyl cis-trans isomerase FkpA